MVQESTKYLHSTFVWVFPNSATLCTLGWAKTGLVIYGSSHFCFRCPYISLNVCTGGTADRVLVHTASSHINIVWRGEELPYIMNSWKCDQPSMLWRSISLIMNGRTTLHYVLMKMWWTIYVVAKYYPHYKCDTIVLTAMKCFFNVC